MKTIAIIFLLASPCFAKSDSLPTVVSCGRCQGTGWDCDKAYRNEGFSWVCDHCYGSGRTITQLGWIRINAGARDSLEQYFELWQYFWEYYGSVLLSADCDDPA